MVYCKMKLVKKNGVKLQSHTAKKIHMTDLLRGHLHLF